jgi:hypothetical protein
MHVLIQNIICLGMASKRAVAMLSSMVTPVYQGYLSEFFRGIKDDDNRSMPRDDSVEYDKARGKDKTLPPPTYNKLGF